MKDKKFLKILKKEVNSITPNDFASIKREVMKTESVETQSKQQLSFVKENFSKHKKWVAVMASCMLVIVAIVGISLPFVFSNNRIMDALFNNNSDATSGQEQVVDTDENEDKTDGQNTKHTENA